MMSTELLGAWMTISSYPVPQMDLKKRTILIYFFCYGSFICLKKMGFASGQLCLLRPSVIARRGIKNVSLVDPVDLTWKFSTAATPMNSTFLWNCWHLCFCWQSVGVPAGFTLFGPVLPQHLKNILCFSTLEFGTVVDTCCISMPSLSCLLQFLLLFLLTSRGHCCWRIPKGLYPTVIAPHVANIVTLVRYNCVFWSK